MSVRALLDELSRKVADAAVMEQVAQQMVRLRDADPAGWNEYLEEGQAWDERTVERLDA
jgi:hypothetical protein